MRLFKSSIVLSLLATSLATNALPLDNLLTDAPEQQYQGKTYYHIGSSGEYPFLQTDGWKPFSVKGDGFVVTLGFRPAMFFNLQLPEMQMIPRALCVQPTKVVALTVRGWEDYTNIGAKQVCIYPQNGKNKAIFFFDDGDSQYGFDNVTESFLQVTDGMGYSTGEWNTKAWATRACWIGFSNCPDYKGLIFK